MHQSIKHQTLINEAKKQDNLELVLRRYTEVLDEQEKNEKIGAGKYSKIIYKSNTSTNKKTVDKSVDKINRNR